MSGNVVPKLSGGPKPDAGKTKREDSSTRQVRHSAATGTAVEDAHPALTKYATSALDVETKIMALKVALEHRRNRPLTPYKADAWESFLCQYNLLVKYPNLVHSLHKGFDAGIRHIHITSAPPNNPNLQLRPEAYQDLVTNEFTKGRYIGPCTLWDP